MKAMHGRFVYSALLGDVQQLHTCHDIKVETEVIACVQEYIYLGQNQCKAE